MQMDQDICTAILLFYSAVLNFKGNFDHGKALNQKKTKMITFCLGIQDSKIVF